MNRTTIKTWQERCAELDGSKGVSNKMIQDAMRRHIKELTTEVTKLTRGKAKTHTLLLNANSHVRRYQKQLSAYKQEK